ncbi:hypothetical protein Tco_0107552 [Tanacetum coccineum]
MLLLEQNKGFLLDEIKATNFELLETSLVVVLDTTDDYVRILGGQRGTIVKCLYTNVCFPDFCGPQKSAGIRKASFLALQDVYDVDDNVPFLFMCHLACVKSTIEVPVGTHQLLPDFVLGSLYDLLIDDPPEIRRAIGELVYDHVIAQKLSSSQPHSSDPSSQNAANIKRVLDRSSTEFVCH